MNGDKQDEPGFASRWSRLKREAKADAPESGGEAEAEAGVTEPEAPVDDDRPDEEVLEELGLPDPDTLKPGDNFAAFMAKAVPVRLRNRALRKLWISDPVLANLDELLDYGEDFTDAATVVENLQTAYQVGKGFVDKVAGLPESGVRRTPGVQRNRRRNRRRNCPRSRSRRAKKWAKRRAKRRNQPIWPKRLRRGESGKRPLRRRKSASGSGCDSA